MTDFAAIRNLFHITESCGFDVKELQPWISRYGRIPEVLKDYYVELGAHPQLNGSQDFLIKPKDLHQYKNDDYLIFYLENQGACVWGIRWDDVAASNPPVYENYGNEEWYQTSESLTEFLHAMAYFQAVISMEFSNEEYWKIDEHVVERIKLLLPSKQADSGLYTGVQFFGQAGEVIAVMNNHDGYLLMFSAEDEQRFDELHATLQRLVDGEGIGNQNEFD
ncbi:hypothetical protein [Paenibacillus macquariensis]|uniref:SMI1/KNR4 family protein n=1 Tax=Paenibacillus macquariensis TaxID=948756 RepID=A0ABY1JV97_9BACL|nr:hypothetical protein [Paenibacillus macquariensis]MEC0090808.1 hypothetical protein [Paenibacillus macquariensis]OAB34548.1 hypothetical protein PMSM_11840 [Paenibacillus macquariensis subsp. macquariensis]SIQ83200.1 hypothetical protein SAMN05421578_104258 [Paenibacillus macquariensis]